MLSGDDLMHLFHEGNKVRVKDESHLKGYVVSRNEELNRVTVELGAFPSEQKEYSPNELEVIARNNEEIVVGETVRVKDEVNADVVGEVTAISPDLEDKNEQAVQVNPYSETSDIKCRWFYADELEPVEDESEIEIEYEPDKEEEQNMSEQGSVQDLILDNVKHGAEQGVVHEGSEIFIDLFREVLGEEIAQDFLESESGREIAKGLGAVGTHYVTTATDILPSNENIERICGVVIQNVSRNLLSPRLSEVREYFTELAELGAALDEDA